MQMSDGKLKSAGSLRNCVQYRKTGKYPQCLTKLSPVSAGMQNQWRGQDLLTRGEEKVHLNQLDTTCA